jgi:hypothetical protein
MICRKAPSWSGPRFFPTKQKQHPGAPYVCASFSFGFAHRNPTLAILGVDFKLLIFPIAPPTANDLAK